MNIESQRDNYKHQVQKLIKDLQTKDEVIVVHDNEQREVAVDINDEESLP